LANSLGRRARPERLAILAACEYRRQRAHHASEYALPNGRSPPNFPLIHVTRGGSGEPVQDRAAPTRDSKVLDGQVVLLDYQAAPATSA
jgi:hypothetical protein